jgi:superfamily II DNA or RNA helicase
VIRIVPLDDVFVRVDCDDAIAHELNDYFSFDQPDAVFMRRNPRYRGWDGKIRLFKLRTRTIYKGLIPRLFEFAVARDYACENLAYQPKSSPNEHDLDTHIHHLTLPFAPDDYQFDAVLDMARQERGIVLSPTGSGKSLIIYLLATLLNERTLIIVPSIGLVTQMTNDMRSYGYENAIHTISAGKSKQSDTILTVSTWQSLQDQPASYFDQFGCVIVDEVHTAKAKVLTRILERCKHIAYRYGFTGTLDNTECHRLILEGLFGTIVRAATTDQLVKRGRLAKPKVIVCVLEYPDDVRKQLKRAEYVDEIAFLCGHEARNKFIAGLCGHTHGPTLVLFQLVEKHGKVLRDWIAKSTHRTVWYITGATSAEDRERIRLDMNASTNDILAASYGTTQVGVNIPNLKNLIFGHPSKSVIRVLQSIGRVLRISEGKSSATIIDIVDDLRSGAYQNHTWRHAEQRMRYYATEKFRVTLKRIPMTSVSSLRTGTHQTSNDTPGAPD